MTRTGTMLCTVLLSMLAVTAQTAAAGLSIRYESDGVRITGAVRGGRVAFIFVDRAPLTLLSGSAVLADTDNDGEVRASLPQGLSDRAVWAAVDLETGEYTAATPVGTVSDLNFRGHSFRGNGGDLKQLESHDFERLDVLLVRPRIGAWALRGSEGGAGDSDGREDHTFLLDVESLKPLLQGFGPPPKKFEKGDVVVLIDPGTSDVFVAGVGK